MVRTGEDRGLSRLGILVCAAALAISASEARAATLVVTTTNDAGPGSLREAVAIAEENGQADLIRIEPTGRILLRSPLQPIDTALSLAGTGAELARDPDAPGTWDAFRILTIAGGGDVELAGLTLSGGRVTDSTAAQGGGVRNAGRLDLRDITVVGNEVDAGSAHGAGGGIYNAGALTVRSSAVRGNAVTGGLAEGGAIYSVGMVSVEDSTLSANRVSAEAAAGAALATAGGSATIRRSTLADNRGPATAVHNESATMTIENSTLSGNDGGVGVRHPGTTTISSSTIASSVGANLVGFPSDVDAHVRVQSTILAGGAPNCSIAVGTIVTSQGHNLADDGSCAFLTAAGDQRNVDPRLGALRANGGPTETMALESTSSAIDRGEAGGLSIDQRGFPRPAGAGADVGAFEAQPLPPLDAPPGTTAPPVAAPPVAEPPRAGAPAPPTNVFRIGRPRRTARGTTVLPVSLPGPGTLVVSGRRIRRVTRRVPARGTVPMPIRARRSRTRRMTVNVAVTYTPLGGRARTRLANATLAARV